MIICALSISINLVHLIIFIKELLIFIFYDNMVGEIWKESGFLYDHIYQHYGIVFLDHSRPIYVQSQKLEKQEVETNLLYLPLPDVL